MTENPGVRPSHIVIVTGQHMVANPRVWKESNTLFRNGYRVTILTVHHDAAKARKDLSLLDTGIDYLPVVNLIPGVGGVSDVYFSRARRRVAFSLKRAFGLDSPKLLAYRPSKMLKEALRQEAELYICHQETGLIVGNELLKRGRRVAFDVEDWYSRDYVNPLRAVKLLDDLEREALGKAAYVSCPSRTMSEALASHHGLPAPPRVIYNGFSIRENEGLPDVPVQSHSLVWFSQVIGPERGLETLVDAMGLVKEPMRLHLVGDAMPGFRARLESGFVGSRHTLCFHPSMDHERLLPFLSGFDIGLALENRHPDSRETTVTNKILQYMQAGNRILATDTLGQQEVAVRLEDRIRLVKAGDPVDWARGIESLNSSGEPRSVTQWQVFRDFFSWEAQEDRLLGSVGQALS